MMLPSDRMTIQNGLERVMKGGIIMARPCNAGQKASTPDMLETDSRLALLQDWLSRDLGLHPQRIEPASSDASFRSEEHTSELQSLTNLVCRLLLEKKKKKKKNDI